VAFGPDFELDPHESEAGGLTSPLFFLKISIRPPFKD